MRGKIYARPDTMEWIKHSHEVHKCPVAKRHSGAQNSGGNAARTVSGACGGRRRWCGEATPHFVGLLTVLLSTRHYAASPQLLSRKSSPSRSLGTMSSCDAESLDHDAETAVHARRATAHSGSPRKDPILVPAPPPTLGFRPLAMDSCCSVLALRACGGYAASIACSWILSFASVWRYSITGAPRPRPRGTVLSSTFTRRTTVRVTVWPGS